MQFATRNWLRATMYKQNTCNLPTESSRFKHCVCSWSNRCCDSQTKFQMFTFYYFPTWPKDWSPLKLIVFFIHLNGFYTYLNESNIVKIHIVLSISLRSKRSPTILVSYSKKTPPASLSFALAPVYAWQSSSNCFSGLARRHVTSCLLGT